MATTIINVSVDVPVTYRLDVLTKQLTDYAKRLVGTSLKVTKPKRHYRHESLCGIFEQNAKGNELVEEYIKEKYEL